MKRIVLTVAAVMALLAPPLARAVAVFGVLENTDTPVRIDSVFWYTSASPDPVREATPGWGGQAPMADTFQFAPLAEFPAAVKVFHTAGLGVDSIDPLVRNAWYGLMSTTSRVLFTDSFTGIAERPGDVTPGLAASAALCVSPNPLAGGLATVRYSLPKAGPAAIYIYDVTGRTVIPRTMAAGRTGAVSLDLREFEAGVYLVKVTTKGFSTTQKLVVQH